MKQSLWILTMVLAVILSISSPAEEKESGDYQYILREDGTAEIERYNGSAHVVEVPEMLDDHPVTCIGHAAFYQCFDMEEIIIPDTVTEIGGIAFYDCQGLKEITIPDQINEIGDNPFDSCMNLETIHVSPGNEHFAFQDGVLMEKETHRLITWLCGQDVRDYQVPEGTVEIGESAFAGCDSLNSVVLPDSVVRIGKEAFCGCTNLQQVEFSGNLKEIGYGAFKYCENLEGVDLPDSVTYIDYAAFEDCDALKEVIFPEHLTVLEANVLGFCSELEEVTIPAGVEQIEYNPFIACEKLTAIHVPEDHPSIAVIDGILYDTARKRLICCPAGLGIEKYVVPEGIEIIDDCAFYGCSTLKEITIPPSVTSIGSQVFDDCEDLEIVAEPGSYAEHFKEQGE